MVNGYLHRLEALEERLGFRECDALCLKCYLRKYRAERDGSEWSGCDHSDKFGSALLRVTPFTGSKARPPRRLGSSFLLHLPIHQSSSKM